MSYEYEKFFDRLDLGFPDLSVEKLTKDNTAFDGEPKQIGIDEFVKSKQQREMIDEAIKKMPGFIESRKEKNKFIREARKRGGVEYNRIINNLKDAEANPYESDGTLMTNAESTLYRLMKRVYNNKLRCINKSVDIFPKVRLADFINIKKQNKYNKELLYAITNKHIDYLVCDGDNNNIIFAVELDDDYHITEDRVQRDEFVNNLLESVGIKLFRVDQKIRFVDESTLTESIDYLLNRYAPKCPECGADCLMMKSRKNRNYGHRFYGCTMWNKSTNKCNYTLDIE